MALTKEQMFKMPDEKDPPWTKKELSIRVGWGELAQAVVEQWKKDGQPDSELIPFWIDMIKAAQAEKNRG